MGWGASLATEGRPVGRVFDGDASTQEAPSGLDVRAVTPSSPPPDPPPKNRHGVRRGCAAPGGASERSVDVAYDNSGAGRPRRGEW